MPGDFPDRVPLRGFEGGAVYTAERGGRFYIVTDESALADLLSDDDLRGLEFQTASEFDSAQDRDKYIRQRGWDKSARR